MKSLVSVFTKRDNPSSHRTMGPITTLFRARGSLDGIKYVISPESIKVQIWDCVVILSIWYYALYLPFRFGISGGYYVGEYDRDWVCALLCYLSPLTLNLLVISYSVYSTGFWIFNVLVNAVFLGEKICVDLGRVCEFAPAFEHVLKILHPCLTRIYS
jgi:hypothetical protein